MSRILPIFFVPDLTRAILENRKTATRRLPSKKVIEKWYEYEDFVCTVSSFDGCSSYSEKEFYEKYPPYQIGDILYVRESAMIHCMKNFDKKVKMLFAADNSLVEFTVSDKEYDRLLKWSDLNKFLSPYWLTKETARLWLKVTDVRIERLRDITEEQALKEGFINTYGFIRSPENEYAEPPHTAREHFISTFLAMYPGTTEASWLWVIEFERCEKPEPCILNGIDSGLENGICFGYARSIDDDEPCEMCKQCRRCTGNDLEDME